MRLVDAIGVAICVVGVSLAMPASVQAQPTETQETARGAAALATPEAGVAARPDAATDVPEGARHLYVRSEARHLYVRSEARHDTARVERLHSSSRSQPAGARAEWRCDTPCALTLAPGTYRLWMSAVALDEELTIDANDVFAEGRPASLIELALGIGVGVAGVVLLAVALLTGEGACLDFGASCPTERGPLALGAGGFALALGVGLMFDSVGFIELTSVRP